MTLSKTPMKAGFEVLVGAGGGGGGGSRANETAPDRWLSDCAGGGGGAGASVAFDRPIPPEAKRAIMTVAKGLAGVTRDGVPPLAAGLEDYMAILPSAVEKAFFMTFGTREERKPYEMKGSVAIISIDGPLMQGASWWFDNYEAISRRFTVALEDQAVTAVVLKINSPGGVCSGCFSTVRALREKKALAGKPVIAFANESAYSAAYAMACIADEIYLPKEGGVGSVGVIGCLWDRTGANEMEGYKIAVITSGEYKADGHPDVPLAKPVIDRYQARINELAQSFAEVVGDARGMSPSAVLKLEAACFYGDAAVKVGLANEVASLEQTIERAQKKGNAAATSRSRNQGALVASTGANMTTPVSSFMAIALALSLPVDASEKDIVSEIGARDSKAKATETGLRAASAKVLEATGTTTPDEAVAKYVATTTKLDELVKAILGSDTMPDGRAATPDDAISKLAADRKAAADKDAESLIERAKSEGKTADEKARGIYKEFGLAALKAHLDALTPHSALATPVVATQKAAVDPTKPASANKDDDEIVLSADDEKVIRTLGGDSAKYREQFIAARRQEIRDRRENQAKAAL